MSTKDEAVRVGGQTWSRYRNGLVITWNRYVSIVVQPRGLCELNLGQSKVPNDFNVRRIVPFGPTSNSDVGPSKGAETQVHVPIITTETFQTTVCHAKEVPSTRYQPNCSVSRGMIDCCGFLWVASLVGI